MPSGSFNARAYSFFDTLLWIACLNLLWIFFALAGAGILGAGPATAAAHIAIRKRVRGDGAPLARSFASHYFSNFGRANAIALPVMGVAVVLAMNWNYFSRSGDVISQLVAAGIFVVAIFLAGAACYLFPMYARYELPWPSTCSRRPVLPSAIWLERSSCCSSPLPRSMQAARSPA